MNGKIADVFQGCVKQPLNIAWDAISYRPREVMKSVAHLGPAKEILGWRPEFDLKKGIENVLEEEKGLQHA